MLFSILMIVISQLDLHYRSLRAMMWKLTVIIKTKKYGEQYAQPLEEKVGVKVQNYQI